MVKIRKSAFIAAFGIVFIIFLTLFGYTYFSEKRYIFTLSESQLQEKLSERLPITKTYLFIIQITLDNPRIHLQDGSDRVHAGLDIALNIRVSGAGQPLKGGMDISGSIAYRPQEGAFYLTDPIVEKLAVQGIPEKYLGKVQHALHTALLDYYTQRPIYTLQSSNMQQAAAKLLLQDVAIHNQKIIFTLGL